MNADITKIILLLACLFCFAACDSEDSDDDMIVVEPESILFTGFSLTDANGQVLSSEDMTDWNLLEDWVDQEDELFSDAPIDACTPQNNQSILPAYPNPSDGEILLGMQNLEGAEMAVRIVDQNFDILVSEDGLPIDDSADFFAFQISSNGTPDTLRMYYRILTSDNCEFRGHGDLIVE